MAWAVGAGGPRNQHNNDYTITPPPAPPGHPFSLVFDRVMVMV